MNEMEQQALVHMASHFIGRIGRSGWVTDTTQLEATRMFRQLLSCTSEVPSVTIVIVCFVGCCDDLNSWAFHRFVSDLSPLYPLLLLLLLLLVMMCVVEHDPPLDRIVAYGLVPVFVDFMKRVDFPTLRVRSKMPSSHHP